MLEELCIDLTGPMETDAAGRREAAIRTPLATFLDDEEAARRLATSIVEELRGRAGGRWRERMVVARPKKYQRRNDNFNPDRLPVTRHFTYSSPSLAILRNVRRVSVSPGPDSLGNLSLRGRFVGSE